MSSVAPPLEYLTRWRMLLAGDRPVNSGDPISVIALTLGYESESAFRQKGGGRKCQSTRAGRELIGTA
jgi:AraC-like DNA-binding protein